MFLNVVLFAFGVWARPVSRTAVWSDAITQTDPTDLTTFLTEHNNNETDDVFPHDSSRDLVRHPRAVLSSLPPISTSPSVDTTPPPVVLPHTTPLLLSIIPLLLFVALLFLAAYAIHRIWRARNIRVKLKGFELLPTTSSSLPSSLSHSPDYGIPLRPIPKAQRKKSETSIRGIKLGGNQHQRSRSFGVDYSSLSNSADENVPHLRRPSLDEHHLSSSPVTALPRQTDLLIDLSAISRDYPSYDPTGYQSPPVVDFRKLQASDSAPSSQSVSSFGMFNTPLITELGDSVTVMHGESRHEKTASSASTSPSSRDIVSAVASSSEVLPGSPQLGFPYPLPPDDSLGFVANEPPLIQFSPKQRLNALDGSSNSPYFPQTDPAKDPALERATSLTLHDGGRSSTDNAFDAGNFSSPIVSSVVTRMVEDREAKELIEWSDESVERSWNFDHPSEASAFSRPAESSCAERSPLEMGITSSPCEDRSVAATEDLIYLEDTHLCNSELLSPIAGERPKNSLDAEAPPESYERETCHNEPPDDAQSDKIVLLGDGEVVTPPSQDRHSMEIQDSLYSDITVQSLERNNPPELSSNESGPQESARILDASLSQTYQETTSHSSPFFEPSATNIVPQDSGSGSVITTDTWRVTPLTVHAHAPFTPLDGSLEAHDSHELHNIDHANGKEEIGFIAGFDLPCHGSNSALNRQSSDGICHETNRLFFSQPPESSHVGSDVSSEALDLRSPIRGTDRHAEPSCSLEDTGDEHDPVAAAPQVDVGTADRFQVMMEPELVKEFSHFNPQELSPAVRSDVTCSDKESHTSEEVKTETAECRKDDDRNSIELTSLPASTDLTRHEEADHTEISSGYKEKILLHPDPDDLPLPLLSQMEASDESSLVKIKDLPAWAQRAAEAPSLGFGTDKADAVNSTATEETADAAHSPPLTFSSSLPGSFPVSESVSTAMTQRRRSANAITSSSVTRNRLRNSSPIEIILAMQLRPIGPDPAWMLRFLMSMFGWFVIALSGDGAYDGFRPVHNN